MNLDEPRLTVVLLQREQVNSALDCLAALHDQDDVPFRLICVDGGSPRRHARLLQREAERRRFELVREERFLTTNQARNIGWRRARTPYVLFLENETMLAPGCLAALLRCADETEADVVGPVTCEGKPLHRTVHGAGGAAHIDEVEHQGQIVRRLIEDQAWFRAPIEALPRERWETGLLEPHCVLVRRSILERIGGYDEGVRNSREHIDFALEVQQAGGRNFVEPAAVATYVTSIRCQADRRLYRFKWNTPWELASVDYLARKWRLPDDPGLDHRRATAGWRRRHRFITPLSRRLLLGVRWRGFTNLLARVEAKFDAASIRRYESRHGVPVPRLAEPSAD